MCLQIELMSLSSLNAESEAGGALLTKPVAMSPPPRLQLHKGKLPLKSQFAISFVHLSEQTNGKPLMRGPLFAENCATLVNRDKAEKLK